VFAMLTCPVPKRQPQLGPREVREVSFVFVDRTLKLPDRSLVAPLWLGLAELARRRRATAIRMVEIGDHGR